MTFFFHSLKDFTVVNLINFLCLEAQIPYELYLEYQTNRRKLISIWIFLFLERDEFFFSTTLHIEIPVSINVLSSYNFFSISSQECWRHTFSIVLLLSEWDSWKAFLWKFSACSSHRWKCYKHLWLHNQSFSPPSVVHSRDLSVCALLRRPERKSSFIVWRPSKNLVSPKNPMASFLQSCFNCV